MRLHLWVSGTVQGVSFRDSLRRQAQRADVTGWVRNEADGRVEALLDGETPAVRSVAAWCRRGPPGAKVEGVVETEQDAGEPYATFEIRR